jgi:hypothetical protein
VRRSEPAIDFDGLMHRARILTRNLYSAPSPSPAGTAHDSPGRKSGVGRKKGHKSRRDCTDRERARRMPHFSRPLRDVRFHHLARQNSAMNPHPPWKSGGFSAALRGPSDRGL